MPQAYENAGVSVEAGYEVVKRIKSHVARTNRPGVVSGIGGFGGLFDLASLGYNEPVLISGTDGVGTKLVIAKLMDKHDTIGIDCVAMCVNDVICCGAKPLFFLDYIAIGKNVPEKVAAIVSGVAEGDVVLALPSSGFHSNGYSLVRKVFDVENADLGRYDDELGETLGEALLRPTVIYVKPVLRCIEAADVKGVSHITGGGFYENVPRCIPDGLCAKIDKAAIKTPAIFRLLQKKGSIDEHDMFNTFNMGVGMAVIVSPETADAALSALKAEGIDAYVCGEIVAGEEKVALC